MEGRKVAGYKIADCIDRRALCEAFAADRQYFRYFDNTLYALLMLEIDQAPRVDAAAVRHGRWIDVKPRWRACSHMQCSVCAWRNTKNASVKRGKLVLNYCPSCGAKMDWEG